MGDLHNCHTHIFNIDNAPKGFLQGFTAKLIAKIAWPVLNTRLGAYIIIKLIRIFASDPHTKKLASFLRVGTMKSQNEIFSELRSKYTMGDKFVVHTINMDHMGAGEAKYDYNEQVHEIKRIKSQNLDTCLPFYSVDPRTTSATQLKDMAEEYVSRRGFSGVKIYPALGFYPFDPKLESFYEWASASGIPIMTHCSREGAYYMGKIGEEMINPDSLYNGPLERWPEKFGRLDFPITSGLTDNSKFCDNFSEVYNYARVLHKFEDLKICFAHSGGVDEILKSEGEDKNSSWFTQIKYLMRTFDNIYADISYVLYSKKVFPFLLEVLKDEDIGHKLLFGTDYFMTLREDSEALLISRFRKYLERESGGEELWKKLAVSNPRGYLGF